jgi:hypothetical protein
MLDNLRRIAPDQLDKIICFDGDFTEVPASQIPESPNYCFIDGEHTYSAVLSDFECCLNVCAPDAAICFHDDRVIYPAIGEILTSLHRRGIPFTARKLSGETFGIFLSGCAAKDDPFIRDSSKDPRAWLRRLRIKDRIPPWLRPAAVFLYHTVAGRRDGA